MWSPRGFEQYRALYPETPAFEVPESDLMIRFLHAWETWSDAELDAQVRALAPLQVVFVRGFLGNWMAGNLVEPCRALVELGLDARIARNRAGHTVEDNVARIAPQVTGDAPLVLCGHSKGGHECLHLADTHPAVRARLRGVILSQAPRGPSAVLESLLLREHADTLSGRRRQAEEWVQRLGLGAIGASPAGRQLTREPLAALLAILDAVDRDYPVWQTASWSSQPTTWLDSFHGRLGEIRPGCAHDGQFYLEDMVWPGLPHVLLPHVDHAQPVLGGYGFDHVRYWKTLISLLAEDRAESA